MSEEKKRRGFATWDRDKLLRTCSKGGKNAHILGRAHEYTSTEARIAGLRGVEAKRRKKNG